MNTVLQPHKHYAAAYLDDVVIISSTWADHVFHLHEVLTILNQADLTANHKKCSPRHNIWGTVLAEDFYNPRRRTLHHLHKP